MNAKDFKFLDDPGTIEVLRAKGYRYIIAGEEFTGEELGERGYEDTVFVEATPVAERPEDPVAYRELSKEGVCDDVYCYIVDPKYFA